MNEATSPWILAATGAFLASIAGVAALLRLAKRPTVMQCISASMNSGLLGASIVLIWYSYFRSNVTMLIGFTLLAGLAGTPAVRFSIEALRSLATFGVGLAKGLVRNWAKRLEDDDEE